MNRKNILLLEPGYKNKYPPLGLMKIAQYHRNQNRSHNIVFAKGPDDPKLEKFEWDRIYVTTLFSFEWKKTSLCLDRAVKLVSGKTKRIFVGGIAASLMTSEFNAIERWQGIRFIPGLLNGPPGKSLQLRRNEFGYRDLTGVPIEERIPDYSILSHIDYQYPVHDAYFGYASRGCVRKCAFCGVPKLEGDQQDAPPLTGLVKSIAYRYGEKKDLLLMDNNITAAPRFYDIMAEIRDLGFTPKAKIKRNGRYYKRRVDFNQGVDSRILAKDKNLIREIATICIDPLRIAFDHLGLRKPYEKSIRDAADVGITSLSNYMLYNFHDSPEDLYQRLRINIDLNNELDIRIWSFPMRYQPVTLKDRSHIGRRWNRYILRSFQIILQATHGVVTGNPSFFSHAFGETMEKFLELLALPHAFIFQRVYFFEGNGRPVLDEFNRTWRSLSETQRDDLMELLCRAHDSSLPSTTRMVRYASLLSDKTIDTKLRNILNIYAQYSDTKGYRMSINQPPLIDDIPEEARVEDAGLFESTSTSTP
ncbi:MAG: radical SAM protein [Ectothiorhodospiraceae bacterium AqS1]|nr:radical SAM protein [Ectothiorhodospiraceae bacterium AqS1]